MKPLYQFVVISDVKSLLIISSFLLFITGAKAQFDNDECKLRKDGIYQAVMKDSTYIYIRFCDNDSIVTTSSDAEPKDASKYIISKHSKLMLGGNYKQNECVVYAKAKGLYGKVKIEGVISNDKLMLTIINVKENNSLDYAFKFFPDNY